MTLSTLNYYKTKRMPKKVSEKEYQLIKQTLLDSDVKTAEQLEEKMRSMSQSAKKYSVIGAIITAIVIYALPKYAVFIVLIYCLYMAWMWSSTISSKQYFKRYLDETGNS